MPTRNAVVLLILALVAIAAVGSAQPVLQWSPPDSLINVGDPLTLSVMLPEALDVRTIELRVGFDPEVIESIDGEPGALFDGFSLFEDFTVTGPGAWYGYCVVLGADDWAVGPGELFRWHVAAADTGSTLLETVSLTLLPPGGGDYPDAILLTGYVNVDVDVTVGAPGATAVMPELSIYPNPFNPRTRVELLLPGGGPGRLEVLDLHGRVVARPWQGVLPVDRPLRVDWSGEDQAGRVLPSGVYVFRLQGSTGAVALGSGVLVR